MGPGGLKRRQNREAHAHADDDGRHETTRQDENTAQYPNNTQHRTHLPHPLPATIQPPRPALLRSIRPRQGYIKGDGALLRGFGFYGIMPTE